MHDLISAISSVENLLAALPAVKQKRHTIYDIAGFPNQETVLSNMLAFYLDENEQHGFGRSFFEALLSILSAKAAIDPELFEGSLFTVERERDYIDILIRGQTTVSGTTSWAIIIENKIGADLYNNLETYWNAISADVKFGIVLSVHPVDHAILTSWSSKGYPYVNILHREWTDAVVAMLPLFYKDADNRHILYLKDFIQNMNSHYPDPIMEKTTSATIVGILQTQRGDRQAERA